MANMKLQVFLLDHTCEELELSSDSTAKDVCKGMARVMGLVDSDRVAQYFSIVANLDGKRKEAIIPEQDRIETWAVRCYKIFLRIITFVDGLLHSRDPGILRLRYIQAVHDLVSGKFMASERTMEKLAALQLQHRYGPYKRENRKDGFVVDRILELLPRSALPLRKPFLWESRIFRVYEDLGERCVNPRAEFLQQVEALDLYGTYRFVCQHSMSPRRAMGSLCINRLGVNFETRERQDAASWEWPEISGWAFDKRNPRWFRLSFLGVDRSDKDSLHAQDSTSSSDLESIVFICKDKEALNLAIICWKYTQVLSSARRPLIEASHHIASPPSSVRHGLVSYGSDGSITTLQTGSGSFQLKSSTSNLVSTASRHSATHEVPAATRNYDGDKSSESENLEDTGPSIESPTTDTTLRRALPGSASNAHASYPSGVENNHKEKAPLTPHKSNGTSNYSVPTHANKKVSEAGSGSEDETLSQDSNARDSISHDNRDYVGTVDGYAPVSLPCSQGNEIPLSDQSKQLHHNDEETPDGADKERISHTRDRFRDDKLHVEHDDVQRHDVEKDEDGQDEVEQDEVEQDEDDKDEVEQDEVERHDVEKDEDGQDEVEQDEDDKDEVEQDEVEQDEVEHDEVEQDEVEQDEVEQDEVEQGEVEQDEVEQGEVEQDEAEQDEAEQNEIEQNEVEQIDEPDFVHRNSGKREMTNLESKSFGEIQEVDSGPEFGHVNVQEHMDPEREVSRLQEEETLKRERAAILLQAQARGIIQRKRLDAELDAMEVEVQDLCASRIQAMYRGYIARCVFDTKRYCATLIQAMFRGYAARRDFDEMERDFAAIYIQAHVRKFLVRLRVLSQNTMSIPPSPPQSPPSSPRSEESASLEPPPPGLESISALPPPPPSTPPPPQVPPPGFAIEEQKRDSGSLNKISTSSNPTAENKKLDNNEPLSGSENQSGNVVAPPLPPRVPPPGLLDESSDIYNGLIPGVVGPKGGRAAEQSERTVNRTSDTQAPRPPNIPPPKNSKNFVPPQPPRALPPNAPDDGEYSV